MIVDSMRDGLLNACQVVSVALPARSPMPIYSKIKAIAAGDTLTLMATDLEVGIRYELKGVRIEENGQAVWPPDRLISILKETKSDSIHIECSEDKAKIRTNNGRYQISLEDPTTYSDVDELGQEENWFEMEAAMVQRMIRYSSFAASKEEGKYAMRATLWEITGKQLRMVTTDGKRMALVQGECQPHGENPENVSALLPAKAVQLLDRLLSEGDPEQQIKACFRPNSAFFVSDKATISTRLAEGRFPPYGNVIPRKFEQQITLPVGLFLTSIRQAAVMTDQESKRVELHFAAGKVKLNARGTETGESDVVMDLPEYAEEPLKIMFDSSYLMDFLRVLDPAQEVTLQIVDPKKAVLFEVSSDYQYMLVPLI
ncbi:MAG: DNA polymerase III subunit beta [Zavarzinella sp.]